MFNLSYANFANAYRRYAETDGNKLVADLGCDEQSARIGNGALLTSLALLSLGIPLAGSLHIPAGPLTGGRAFTGANRLADWLGERFASPEVISLEQGLGEVAYQLFGRRGVAAFIQESGPQGGQIGLLDGRNANSLCCAAENKHPLEVRFWELH
ncbi:hypothetical protein LZ012_11095 [Dechloromonas sp. XY25]|uniref:Uncharacterized protein n=1 Tax=Dechloromonas hankyongensis TaxID=2908002 RepID=A0ABS9K325_9RHOO|nr:hypothetical protein [Dechloromonas hankyongensis]MCG2577541.1 hypothetical protein [Dechloromonas hankyongensis]